MKKKIKKIVMCLDLRRFKAFREKNYPDTHLKGKDKNRILACHYREEKDKQDN